MLSAECKNLISRMLVTDPRQRASLSDIMNHPWITKGFNAPPENYLPHREPLQLPLDPQVVEKMTGFDFGPSEFISRELTRIITSEEYQHAARMNAREQASQASGMEKKRGVFDFYKRRNSTASRDTLPNTSSEAVQLGLDPVNAFSPLLSIYYLVREKQERERAEANPGALSMPMSPGEKPIGIPDLPAPEAAYTNSYAREMPGEKATGGRARARSRTQGEEDVAEGLKKINLNVPPGAAAGNHSPQIEQMPAKKESTGMGLLRRFSTRRGRESRVLEKTENTQQAPSLQLPQSDLASQPRKSFSVRRSRNRDPPAALLHPSGSTPHQAELLTPTAAMDGRARTSNALDRSASVNSADYRKRQSRRGVSEGQAAFANLEPPLTSGSERSSISGHKSKASEPAAPLDQKSSLQAQAATARAKSLGHARRESMQIRRAQRAEAANEDNVPEETDNELAPSPENINKSSENLKPVYLKGLFSVSTTSNKPLPVIRMDIIRVLNELGVSFQEIKGGFSCRHAPSIDLNRDEKHSPPSPEIAAFQSPQHLNQPPHRRRISFAGGIRDRLTPPTQDIPSSEKYASSRNRLQRPQAPPINDNSFTASSGSESEVPTGTRPPRSRRSVQAPGATPPPSMPTPTTVGPAGAGETTTQVQNDLGGDMVLDFEILIVKVPWFRLHGVQFKKIQGGTWQYKDVAAEILNALRL